MTDRERGQLLSEPIALAWRAFDRAADRTCRVTPAVPILFFGDLDAYRASPLRVATVGLNPSLHEFPRCKPFLRFPLAEGSREPSRYLRALSAYFRTKPYSKWFNAFEPLLNGLGASYYPGAESTALHTDICSPVATDPTWNELDETNRTALEGDGCEIWDLLLKALQPQIVLISVAKARLQKIQCAPKTDWEIIHAFKKTANGDLRKKPYEVHARWYDVAGEHSLFVFGTGNIKPFLMANSQKRKSGELIRKEYYKNAR